MAVSKAARGQIKARSSPDLVGRQIYLELLVLFGESSLFEGNISVDKMIEKPKPPAMLGRMEISGSL